MNPVAAANGRGQLMLVSTGFDRREQLVHIIEQYVRRAGQLDGHTGVEYIA